MLLLLFMTVMAKMLTTDKLSDFKVTSVSAGMTGNTNWASNIFVEDYSKKLSQETIDAMLKLL